MGVGLYTVQAAGGADEVVLDSPRRHAKFFFECTGKMLDRTVAQVAGNLLYRHPRQKTCFCLVEPEVTQISEDGDIEYLFKALFQFELVQPGQSRQLGQGGRTCGMFYEVVAGEIDALFVVLCFTGPIAFVELKGLCLQGQQLDAF